MRLRHKPYAVPELLKCGFYKHIMENLPDETENFFSKKQNIALELGCGMGSFISQMAYQNPKVNYIGIDKLYDVLVMTKRSIEEAFAEKREIDNVLIFTYDIERIAKIFWGDVKVSEIYINFCNPWPKLRHQKRRLTHTKQLMLYRNFLEESGNIFFKTDNTELYEASLEYFEQAGFSVVYSTRNLQQSTYLPLNISTEYERKWREKGVLIKAIVAQKR